MDPRIKKNKTFKCFHIVHINGKISFEFRGRRDRVVVGFTSTCAISAYHQ